MPFTGVFNRISKILPNRNTAMKKCCLKPKNILGELLHFRAIYGL
jgi:hypothetical protein